MTTTTADSERRVTIPQATPGQVYAVHDNSDGSFTVKAVSVSGSADPTCHLAEENGFPVAVPHQPIDEQAIRELLADFP